MLITKIKRLFMFVGIVLIIAAFWTMLSIAIYKHYLRTAEANTIQIRTVDDILQSVSESSKVPYFYLKTIAIKESSLTPGRSNEAPTVQARAKKQAAETSLEFKLRTGALGLMGVVPYYHAKRCNLSIPEFFDAEKNAICGAKFFGDCILRVGEKEKSGSKLRLLEGAFACYHGSGPAARDYAADALRILTKLAIEDNIL